MFRLSPCSTCQRYASDQEFPDDYYNWWYNFEIICLSSAEPQCSLQDPCRDLLKYMCSELRRICAWMLCCRGYCAYQSTKRRIAEQLQCFSSYIKFQMLAHRAGPYNLDLSKLTQSVES